MRRVRRWNESLLKTSFSFQCYSQMFQSILFKVPGSVGRGFIFSSCEAIKAFVG